MHTFSPLNFSLCEKSFSKSDLIFIERTAKMLTFSPLNFSLCEKSFFKSDLIFIERGHIE